MSAPPRGIDPPVIAKYKPKPAPLNFQRYALADIPTRWKAAARLAFHEERPLSLI
jgi:hypothetical protein